MCTFVVLVVAAIVARLQENNKTLFCSLTKVHFNLVPCVDLI